MRELLRAWRIQKRVWGALFMREIQTRWGRRNLGFAWLFAEPLVFAMPVLTVWSILRGRAANCRDEPQHQTSERYENATHAIPL